MRAKNLLLGEVEDDPIYTGAPNDKGYLTADEVALEKYTEQEPNDIISKKVDIPRREMRNSPMLEMPTRNAQGEKVEWKPQHVVNKEDAKRAGERATRIASSVKEWLASNPDAEETVINDSVAAEAAQRPVHNYSEIWDAYKQANAQHEREKQDLEKKRRRDQVLAGLADGLGAFHEAYSYARGLEPMKGVGEASKKVADAYDKRRLLLDKDYKDRMDEILNHLKMERQMELDANTRWWRDQDLKERQRWHDMTSQGKEDATNKRAETEAKKAEQKDKQLAQGDRRLDQRDQEIDIKRNNQGKSSSGKSGTKKGKQTKKKKKSSLYGGKKKLY